MLPLRLGYRSFCSAIAGLSHFEHLLVNQLRSNVIHVQLNRPEKLNAINETLWQEIGDCFSQLAVHPSCRVVVLSGMGRLFCSGIDFNSFAKLSSIAYNEKLDTARKAFQLRALIEKLQAAFTNIEKCPKPVLCSVHGACIGAGFNLFCSTDIRYCSSDAYFQMKEVQLGFAADVGILQRLPKMIGNHSLMREFAFTGKQLMAEEALRLGLVSRILPSSKEALQAIVDLAENISIQSPVAVQTIKLQLNHARDYPVDVSLQSMVRCVLFITTIFKFAFRLLALRNA
ncbi:delta(3' 5') delta(2,4) dienoyl coenzyme a isomer ase [Trichuris trichiura]|uniref:Delta(3' 5') delta(2,4) dienoyl coenzyme a isomer ase n=1 Tax=Trichuris trichiura TaxID=36087 RepID=A0A077YWK2_TRITR|nr:delta(3' 5') delta(2,4) dienoyl coenzyme a isomer ase [Trichuris trichiura]